MRNDFINYLPNDILVKVDRAAMMHSLETRAPFLNPALFEYCFYELYQKNEKIINHVQWFKPSLGWSSGPTALKMACDHGHKDIYILGFDYRGHKQDDKGNVFKFNNVV